VKRLVIFLNELSCTSAPILPPYQMLPHVLETLRTIRAVRTIRSDLIVAANTSLAGVSLGDGTHSLATILRGDANKEEWRFLISLDQTSPWGAYSAFVKPGEMKEVTYNGNPATGMLWAQQNDSTVYSFAFPPDWGESRIEAQFHEMDGNGNVASTGVSIPNLSRAEHVTALRAFINDYGGVVSASTLIYEGTGFVVRMYFNDHPPPHFHVLSRRDTSDSLATCAIETLDVLKGDLSAEVRRRVRAWAETRKPDLITNWERCRTGERPFLLDDPAV
jgi:hypothetical protein